MDQIDLLILRMYDNASKDGKPMPSIPEIVNAIPSIRSTGAVHKRLTILVEQGLVDPPARKNMPRSYRISKMGRNLLRGEDNPDLGGYPTWPPR